MKFKKYIFIISIILFCALGATDEQLSTQPIIDESEAQDADFAYFNDPYLFEQQKTSPEYNVITLGQDGITSNANGPVLDMSETTDVDFSYFNDPYAFEAFRTGLPIKAKFGGYLQYSAWWDSRQCATFADGYILLFPKKTCFDVDCRDINSQGECNMTMIETRPKLELFGPKVLGAETFGYLEADMIGDGILINRLRLRHAFMELTWEHTKVLMGQFWHPFFVIKTFPLTVSFANGVPIEPFSRNPQITITAFNTRGTELLLAATTQLEFVSDGPKGLSSIYQRDSLLPDFTARLTKQTEHNYAGIGFNFMRLKPRLESNTGYKVNESINSFRFCVFDTITFEPLEIRSQLTYAQNATNLALQGGYAVYAVNPATDERKYTNLRSINYWLDINITRKIEPGLFVGISKNLGANRTIIPCIYNSTTRTEEKTIYGSFDDSDQIDILVKVAPRVRIHVLPIDFAAEIEYVRAGFGCINNHGRINNPDPVTNVRIIFTAYYYF